MYTYIRSTRVVQVARNDQIRDLSVPDVLILGPRGTGVGESDGKAVAETLYWMRARSLQPPILPYNRIGAWCQPCLLSRALFSEAHFVRATSHQRPSLHETATSITVGDSECCSATESVVRELPALVLAGTQLGYL